MDKYYDSGSPDRSRKMKQPCGDHLDDYRCILGPLHANDDKEPAVTTLQQNLCKGRAVASALCKLHPLIGNLVEPAYNSTGQHEPRVETAFVSSSIKISQFFGPYLGNGHCFVQTCMHNPLPID